MNGYEMSLYLLEKNIQSIPLSAYKTPMFAFKDIVIDNRFIENNQYYYQNASCMGVLTRGLWCIDIDRNHGNDQDGFMSLSSIPFYYEIDQNAKETMIQSTPSGGMHIIFRKKEGIEYSQKISYLDGVDIKANDNNYFVLAGSVTSKGIYQRNDLPPKVYEGDFENRIFGAPGNFRQQIIDKHSVKKVMNEYNFSHLPSLKGTGGLGKQAYKRIVDGISIDRNNDLYLAASYAKACNIQIEPLKIVIGSSKGKDVFTENEFWKTVESAMKN